MIPEKNVMIKHNRNLIENPIWALSQNESKSIIINKDNGTYKLESKYKLTEKVDIVFLFYILKLIQKNNYNNKLTTSRYEILKNCNFQPNPHNYSRLKESLNRWINVVLTFENSFNSTNSDDQKITKVLNIINDYTLDNKKLTIHINEEFLKIIQENKYFSLIDFNIFKSFKSPLSARLYELFLNSFFKNNEYKISSHKLIEKLTLQVKYPSQVKEKLDPCLKELNAILDYQIHYNAYKNDDNDTIFQFFKTIKEKETNTYNQNQKSKNEGSDATSSNHPTLQPDVAFFETQPGRDLISLVQEQNKYSDAVKALIIKASTQYDFDYIKRNILYSNDNAKDNYTSYLALALKDNWGLAYKAREEAKKEQAIQSIIDEDKKQAKRQAEAQLLNDETNKCNHLQLLLNSLSTKEKQVFISEITSVLKENGTYNLFKAKLNVNLPIPIGCIASNYDQFEGIYNGLNDKS